MYRADEMVEYQVDYRRDIVAIDHPDALLIAAAPDLLAENTKLKERWERLKEWVCASLPMDDAAADAYSYVCEKMAEIEKEGC